MCLLISILTFQVSVGEGYDFSTYEEFDLSEMEEVWKEEGDIIMSWTEAIEMMKIEELESVKNVIEEKDKKIKEMEWEKQIMFETWEEEKKEKEKRCQEEKNELESENNVKVTELSGKLKNKNLLIKFLSTLVQKNERQYKVSREVIRKQNEMLKFLGEERKTYLEKEKLNLKQAYHQTQVIISQERQKDGLKEIIKLEETLKEEFQNLTELNTANTANCPVHVQAMAKIIEDQMEDFNKLR